MHTFPLGILIYIPIVCSLSPNEITNFVLNVIREERKPVTVLSLLNFDMESTYRMSRAFALENIYFAHMPSLRGEIENLQENIIFLADIGHADADHNLRKAESFGLLKSPRMWILFVDDCSLENTNIISDDDDVKHFIEEKFTGIDVRVYSEVIIVHVDDDFYTANMIYRIRPHFSLVWEPYCTWSPQSEFTDLRSNRVTALRRQKLNTTINVVTVITNNNSLLHLEEYGERHVDTMAKGVYHFQGHLVEFVNGTPYRYNVPTWGYKQPNGRFDGLINELSSGNADISGSPMIMAEDRFDWMEFIGVNMPLKGAFIFRKPPLSTVANLFLLPFGADVWLFSFFTIVTVSVCTFLTWLWEDKKRKSQEKRLMIKRFADATMDSLCMVFQQGTWKEPLCLSGRIVLLFGLLSFMFLFTAYSAYIVALLQSTTNNISTLRDLITSPLQLFAQDTLYSRYFFSTETEPDRRELFLKKMAPRGVNKSFISPEKGVKMMREGLFAFHSERVAAYDIVQRTFLEEEKCNFMEISFLRMTFPYQTIAPDSPYKENWKIGMKRIMESGVQSRSLSRILTTMPTCAGGGGIVVSVSLSDCIPAFQCLLAGSAFALAMLGLEIFVHRKIKARKIYEANPIDNEIGSVLKN